jgi:putative hydrolase of the HAD superfamily
MIKAVIFDWGGVLIDETLGKMDKYCADVLDVKVENYNVARQKGFDDFARGDITEYEFWQIVCSELDIDMPSVDSLWGDAVEEVFNEKVEMFELIERLKEQGYKIGFLSNTEMPAVEYWKKNNYEKYFDEKVFSCVERIAKPDREIYQMICNRMDILPEESVFIDDKSEFIDGAKSVGMKGIIFENSEQVKNDLYKILNIKNMDNIQEQLADVQERNERVELNKAWETSFMRRGFIAGVTYLNALVPTGGYLLSTLSLPFIKRYWIRNKQ